MKTGRATIDPFVVFALLFMGVCAFIVFSVFIQKHVVVFTNEDQIDEAKTSEFGFFAEYL